MGTYAPHRLAVLWAALQLECAVLRRGGAARRTGAVRGPRRPSPTHARARPHARSVCRPPPGPSTTSASAASSSTPATGWPGSRTRFTAGRIELAARRRLALDAAGRARAGSSPR